MPRLLLVDDDQLIVESLASVLEGQYEVVVAGNRLEAIEKFEASRPDIALVDLGLPPLPHTPVEGFALVEDLLARDAAMKVLVLSGQDAKDNARRALALGAVDFIAKPCDPGLLRARLQHQVLIREIESQHQQGQDGRPGGFHGDSPAIRQLTELVEQFARTPFPVLVEGESGVGKELVARYLHDCSDCADAPFLSVNCAAFTADLLESQLFGHVRGAFTGAAGDRAGFFAKAGSGTLFLDEIGEFPLQLQPKLLRVLENGEYYRIGDTEVQHASARVVAATNRDLRSEVQSGNFRADLYHRLSVLSIKVPALRERGRDWEVLLDYFQDFYRETFSGFHLGDEARERLANYSFPGNIRELRNIVIRLGAKMAGKSVSLADLEAELEATPESAASFEEPEVRVSEQLREGGFQLEQVLRETERRYVTVALEIAHGNLSHAARILGINRTTLYSRLQRLGLGETDRDEPED